MHEKDPDYVIPSHHQQKFILNEFIANSFQKIGERMNQFFINSEENIVQPIQSPSSNFDQYYNFGEENFEKSAENKKDEIKQTNYSEFIEKAHELYKENDPKTIYTEFRKKKPNDKNLASEEKKMKNLILTESVISKISIHYFSAYFNLFLFNECSIYFLYVTYLLYIFIVTHSSNYFPLFPP